MTVNETAQYWLEQVTDPELHKQLVQLLEHGTQDERDDAFFQDLSFGTAGLRGIIGPGTNRMNIYTVGRATQGLANYILANCDKENPAVAIARDSRHMGEEFVRHAACVLAANGIHVHIYPRIEPTPALSFAVRDLECFAGICMTASHNPAPYNGYKAYGADGCQITSEAARLISEAIESINPFFDVNTVDFAEAEQAGLISWIPDATLQRFINAVLSCGLESQQDKQEDISLVYTPLCGTGLECMEEIFKQLELNSVQLVAKQAQPNGSFPTCKYPNPEERAALELGIEQCKRTNASLLLATDPDADRIGIAVRHNQHYVLPTGNEVGILLLDYICRMRTSLGTMPANPIAVSTIVSTAMIDSIANHYGVEIKRTLTGFKYIGEIIGQLELAGEQARFIFGFEESYDYLSGSHVRDKDAINAGLLICQMARYYQARGMDLIDALDALYQKYGYFCNRTINIAFPGARGASEMAAIMEKLRTSPLKQVGQYAVLNTLDYTEGISNLPKANVVEMQLAHQGKIIFRPSGTEPKIKLYLFGYGTSAESAKVMLDTLEQSARNLVE